MLDVYIELQADDERLLPPDTWVPIASMPALPASARTALERCLQDAFEAVQALQKAAA